MKKDICYIIVSYNGGNEVLKLASVFKNHSLIIVDNASVDGSIERIKKTYPSITILINKDNIGYGPAANTGIKSAYKKGFNWFVILNQDISISKNSINKFNKRLNSSLPSIIGPFKGQLDIRRYTSILNSATNSQIDYISGSFIAVNKKIVEKIGYFYEPYFMYYEDVDYCIRAKEYFPLYHIKLDDISHKESSSLGIQSFLHQYYLSRNHLKFVQRLAPVKVKGYEIVRFPKTILEHISKKEFGAIYGVRDFVLGRFGRYY